LKEVGVKGYRAEELRRMLYRLKKNKLSILGLILVSTIFFIALFAEIIAPYPEDSYKIHIEKVFQPPSWEHPFGTDEMGRDVLSRVILGSRISLILGISVIIVAVSLGTVLGLIAGYLGGFIGSLIMRVTDVFLSVPSMALVLAVSAVVEPTMENLIFAISFGWWPWYTRLVYGEVLSLKEEEFVQAAESLGAPSLYIMFKEILPNLIPILIVKGSLDMGYAILTGSILGFLGLGVRPPTPEWGTMIGNGRLHLPGKWWLTFFPGLAIFLTVFSFNLLGDGLRDALDVKLE